MNQPLHLSVVPTEQERDDDSRLVVRLCESLWRSAEPRSRVQVSLFRLAELTGCSPKWAGLLTDRMEARLLLQKESHGVAGTLFKLLVPLEEALDAMAPTSHLGLNSSDLARYSSDLTSDLGANRSDLRSDLGATYARETLPAPPPAPHIGIPISVPSSDLTSDLDSNASALGTGGDLPPTVKRERLTPDGLLAYLGMGHAPERVYDEFAALTDEQRDYCVTEVLSLEPPTTNWRALRSIMRTARARGVGIHMQQAAGQQPAIGFGQHEMTSAASYVEVAVAAAVAAVRALDEERGKRGAAMPVSTRRAAPAKQRDPFAIEVGDRLRTAREAWGGSQEAAAIAAGITQAALSNYERGKRVPPMRTLMSLATVLGTSAVALMPELARAEEA